MSVIRILPDQAKELSEKERVQWADVRDIISYQAGHIQSAIHLDEQSLPHFLAQANKTLPVIVYCAHGVSSLDVAYYLNHHGFQTVYSLEGGIEAWQRNYPSPAAMRRPLPQGER